MIDDNNFSIGLDLKPNIDKDSLKDIENKISNISTKEIQRKISNLSVLSQFKGEDYTNKKEELTRLYQLNFVKEDLQNQMKQLGDLKADKSTLEVFDKLSEELREVNEQIEKLAGTSVKEVKSSKMKEESKKSKFDFKEFLGFDTSNLKSIGSDILTTIFPKAKLADLIIEPFMKAIEFIKNSFQESFSNAIKELGEQAKYSLGTTNIYDRNVVNNALQYGLVGKESYALDKALKETGMSNINDLLTAQMLGMTGVLENFKEEFDSYVESYEETQKLAMQTQRFQDEIRDFKRGLMQEFMQFFIDNEDFIISALKTTTTVLSEILKGVSAVINFLSGGRQKSDEERIQETNEIIWRNSNTTTYNNDSRVFNFNNNFTATGTVDNSKEIARMLSLQTQSVFR